MARAWSSLSLPDVSQGTSLRYVAAVSAPKTPRSPEVVPRAEDARFELLASLAASISADMPIDAILGRVVSSLAAAYPAYSAAYSTIDAGGVLHCLEAVAPAGLPDARGASVDLCCAPLYLEALRGREPVVVADVLEDERVVPLREVLTSIGIRAMLDVPLRHGGELSGLLCLDSSTPAAWSAVETRTLRAIADFLELAIRDARARDEQRATERELRAMTERLRTLVDTFPEAVLVEDRSRHVVLANRTMRVFFGIPPEVDVVGSDCAASLRADKELFAEPDAAVARVDELLARGQPCCEEVQLADGRVLERDYHPVRIGAESEGHLWVYRDVTQRRKLLAQLQATERLRSLGTLAAGVAHEINNPLTYVVTNVELLHEALETPDAALLGDRRELAAMVGELRDGATRVQRIVRALGAFARAEPAVPVAPTDLGVAIERALVMAQSELRSRATLVTELAATRAVLGDESRIVQVVVNLVVNAAQAIPEGAVGSNHVRLSTRDVDLPSGERAVALEIEDTGTGIPSELRARVFEPFFTTKPVGTGTGLGLSICHGIVAALGGRLELEPGPGGVGTLARVTLRASP